MKDVVKQEVLPGKEEPKKIEFDLKYDESNSTHYYIWADYSTKIFHASTSFIIFLNREGFSSILPRKFVVISMKIFF